MERLFDLPPGQLNLETPVLIVRSARMGADLSPVGLLGLSVDHVREIISANLSAPKTNSSGAVLNGCAVAQVGFGDFAIHVLSAERLLMEQERRTIDRLQAEMQARLDRFQEECCQ
jgi:chemotaxis signal transduction protein